MHQGHTDDLEESFGPSQPLINILNPFFEKAPSGGECGEIVLHSAG